MYSIRENPPQDVQKTLESYDPLTQRLLYARGITTKEEADFFFEKKWIDIDPYVYTDMQKAAQRVLDAVKAKEVIGIYSDYDCDGIPAAAAMHSTLNAFGHTAVAYYVPDRNMDGFGLNDKGIQYMIDSAVNVVCIFDCGTSDPDGVAKLQAAGIDTIIVDHHLPGDIVPESFACINPTMERHIPKPHPCAAGVAYFFIQAIINQAQDMSLTVKPKSGWEKWQLDIIALATLSDMVPLRGINRQIIHYGLQVMRKSHRPGIHALCEELKIDQRKITQDDLTFLVVPRINAASRMGDARLAFNLLTTDDIAAAKGFAAALTKLNNTRKTTVASMVRQARKQVTAKNPDKAVWVFGDRAWRPSLVGLVAQKLAEAHDKTVFVWGQSVNSSGDPVMKGSCRSAKHNTFEMMREVSELFTEAGGHAQAGGFTLVPAAELLLEDRLNETQASAQNAVCQYCVDSECTIRDIQDVLSLCDRFAPFGKENEQVCIAIPHVTAQSVKRFGKNKEHTRYIFADGTGTANGIIFFTEEHEKNITEGQHLRAVIGSLEWDFFRNAPRIRVKRLIQ